MAKWVDVELIRDPVKHDLKPIKCSYGNLCLSLECHDSIFYDDEVVRCEYYITNKIKMFDVSVDKLAYPKVQCSRPVNSVHFIMED